MKRLFLIAYLFLAVMPSAVQAAAPSAEQCANAIDIKTVLQCITKQSDLPTFEGSGAHPDASLEPGARQITSAIFFGLDAFKLGVGSVAVLAMIISGIQLVMAGDKIDEEVEKQKNNFKFALMGFLLIIMADMLVRKMFFGEAGEAFASDTDVALFGEEASKRIGVIYNILQGFTGAVAILMIVVSGIKMMTTLQEDQVLNAKKHIGYASVGLFAVAVSEFFVKGILFVDRGQSINVSGAVRTVTAVGNFIASAMGIIGVLVFAYGGFLYVTAFGKDDQTTKAKKIFFAGIVSFLIAAGAFAIASSVAGIATPAFPQ